MAEIAGPVNMTRMSEGPAVAELAELGVVRVSWALYLYWDAMARFKEQLASLQT
jgi:2-methylisocitrate lyase-like PEP mutase family enzyme